MKMTIFGACLTACAPSRCSAGEGEERKREKKSRAKQSEKRTMCTECKRTERDRARMCIVEEKKYVCPSQTLTLIRVNVVQNVYAPAHVVFQLHSLLTLPHYICSTSQPWLFDPLDTQPQRKRWPRKHSHNHLTRAREDNRCHSQTLNQNLQSLTRHNL